MLMAFLPSVPEATHVIQPLARSWPERDDPEPKRVVCFNSTGQRLWEPGWRYFEVSQLYFEYVRVQYLKFIHGTIYVVFKI